MYVMKKQKLKTNIQYKIDMSNIDEIVIDFTLTPEKKKRKIIIIDKGKDGSTNTKLF